MATKESWGRHKATPQRPHTPTANRCGGKAAYKNKLTTTKRKGQGPGPPDQRPGGHKAGGRDQHPTETEFVHRRRSAHLGLFPAKNVTLLPSLGPVDLEPQGGHASR
jgi:hypothetical protein